MLTEVERIKALAAQLVKLLRAQRSSSLPVSQLLSEYSKTFGYGLRLQDYDASTLPALLAKLCHVVKVTQTLALLDGLCGCRPQTEGRAWKSHFDWIRERIEHFRFFTIQNFLTVQYFFVFVSLLLVVKTKSPPQISAVYSD